MSALKSAATAAIFYTLYKLAGGPLPWWPLWAALGLGLLGLYLEVWARNIREAR